MKRLILLLLVSTVAFAAPTVNIKGGKYYHLELDGVEQPRQFRSDEGAKQAAINASFNCNCTVMIIQPKLTVTTTQSAAVPIQEEIPIGDVEIPIVVVDGGTGEPTEPVPTLGTATLSWDIPTKREDGTALALAEIQGYKIAYWTDPNSKTYYTVPDASTVGHVFADLPAGVYYFTILTVDSDGLEGSSSSPISLTIDV